MNKNGGGIDQTLRVIVGLALIAMVFVGPQTPWGWIGLVPLATAVHRLTGLPAGQLGLRDRGLLRAGSWADIVVFDAGQIIDHADFESPQRFATGVLHVLVNGVPSWRAGEPSGVRAGRVPGGGDG